MTEPLTLAQRSPGCPDCKPLGSDLSVCTEKCAPKEWLIKKGGYYYRQNFCGYTTAKFEAGRYTEQDACKEATIEPWHMKAIHQDEVPDDLPSRTVADLEATIASLRVDNKALTERLETAYRVKAECNDDANRERHHRLDAEAKLAKVEAERDEARADWSKAATSGIADFKRSESLSAKLAEARSRLRLVLDHPSNSQVLADARSFLAIKEQKE